MMSNEQNLTLDALNSLSEEERALAIEILKEFSEQGASTLLEQIKYADFDEIPVDIHTFMHDKKYLGNALTDPEGRFTVFPYWENKLMEIFPDNITTQYNTIVFTGAIGLGKSTIAVICLLYLLYRLLCLKDPYLYYGLQPIDKISISLMNITLENAKGVALDKMNQMILTSEWFLAHGEMGGTTNLVYRPGKHIELITASSNNQVIGRAIFANFTDEVNFGLTNDVEKLKKKQKTLISQIDARMKSRFLRGTYLPTLNIIASSKNSEQSFLEDYINTKKQNESKTTLIVDEPQWVVDSRKDSPIKFYVAIGNKFLANELLPLGVSEETLDAYRAKGYSLLQVPIGYLDNFQDNIDGALCDIAGIATASSLKYISGERLNQTKTASYKNPFTKDIIEVGNGPEDIYQYANFFDLSVVSPDDLGKPLFIHLDMSLSGDKTGIAGVWITGKSPSKERQALLPSPEQQDLGVITEAAPEGWDSDSKSMNLIDESARDLRYKLAFSVSVKAPKGFQVSFEKNRNFIRWLREHGFAIKGVSSDTFQSATIQQELKADGFNTSILSVDRVDRLSKTNIPYHYFKSAIYEQRIQIYQKCDLLTEEIVGLERLSDGHVDHTANGINSKDQSDAVCGALFLASKFANEYSYSYGDNLDTALEANDIGTDTFKKQQLIAEFEAELSKIGMDFARAQKVYSSQQQEELQYYQDLEDGIIIV